MKKPGFILFIPQRLHRISAGNFKGLPAYGSHLTTPPSALPLINQQTPHEFNSNAHPSVKHSFGRHNSGDAILRTRNSEL